jgi:hypothetical protein
VLTSSGGAGGGGGVGGDMIGASGFAVSHSKGTWPDAAVVVTACVQDAAAAVGSATGYVLEAQILWEWLPVQGAAGTAVGARLDAAATATACIEGGVGSATGAGPRSSASTALSASDQGGAAPAAAAP